MEFSYLSPARIALICCALLSGCVSFDVVKSQTVRTGDPAKKQGTGEVVETRGGVWSGVVINALVPLPPLVIKHGDEQTIVWKENGVEVYREKTDTRVQGVACVLLVLQCGDSSAVGSWGNFLFDNSGGYH